MNKYDINLKKIYNDIINDQENIDYTNKGWQPLYNVTSKSKILIIGQAPGIKAQTKNKTWDDKSGDKLRTWLGVTKSEFFNPDIFGMLPMDFYYPGKGKTGDLPPRIEFAQKWHPKIISNLPNLKLIVLIGNYSQKYYLGDKYKRTLTETVKSFKEFIPNFFPLPHPSPLNFRWFNNNLWFELEALPKFKKLINAIIKENA